MPVAELAAAVKSDILNVPHITFEVSDDADDAVKDDKLLVLLSSLWLKTIFFISLLHILNLIKDEHLKLIT